MISPLGIHRASRQWGCGWFVAWTRLRCRREYWSSHAPAEDTSRPRTLDDWTDRRRKQQTSPQGQ
jgi:hypothetical protein